MPLIVTGQSGGSSLSEMSGPATEPLHELWKKFPSLLLSGKKLLGLPVVEIGPKRLLYVSQREYAVVHPTDEHIDVLGTEDATTCHIAILRHTGSGVTSLAHYDGCGLKEGVHDMVQCVQDMSVGETASGRLELTLAGGFMDDNQSSEKLSREMLDIFQADDHDIHLVTACITDMNDTMKGTLHFPVIYGLAVNVKTGEIMRATFPEKGPALSVRSAPHFVGLEKMMNIYDPQTGQITVGPFDWKPLKHVEQCLALPDSLIRRYLSTSPEQEPDHFSTQVREALQVIRDHPFSRKTLFPNGLPWRYRLGHDGAWTCVDR